MKKKEWGIKRQEKEGRGGEKRRKWKRRRTKRRVGEEEIGERKRAGSDGIEG